MIECLKYFEFAVTRKTKIATTQRHKKWCLLNSPPQQRTVRFKMNGDIFVLLIYNATVLFAAFSTVNSLKPRDFVNGIRKTIWNNSSFNYHMGTRFEVCFVWIYDVLCCVRSRALTETAMHTLFKLMASTQRWVASVRVRCIVHISTIPSLFQTVDTYTESYIQ